MSASERLRRPEPPVVRAEEPRAEEQLDGLEPLGNQAVARLARSAATDEWAGQTVPGDIQRSIDAKRGGGQPLPRDVASRMGDHLGDDLSDVRVHTDSSASELSRTVQAKAFTTGRDVFFGAGEYRPGSSGGDELLAHELTHVVQQRGVSTSGPLRVSTPGDAQERQADALGQGLARAVDERTLSRDVKSVVPAPVFPPTPTVSSPPTTTPPTNQQAPPAPTPAAPPTPAVAPPGAEAPAEVPVTPADGRMIQGLVVGPLTMAMGQMGGEPDVRKAGEAGMTCVNAYNALNNIANAKQHVTSREKYDPVREQIQDAAQTLRTIAEADTESQAEMARSQIGTAISEVARIAAFPVQDDAAATPAQQGANSSQTGTVTKVQKTQLEGPIKSQLEGLKDKLAGKPGEDWDPKALVGQESVYVGMIESLGIRELTQASSNIKRAFSTIKVMAQSLDEAWGAAHGKVAVAMGSAIALGASASEPPQAAGTAGAAGAAGGQVSASGEASSPWWRNLW